MELEKIGLQIWKDLMLEIKNDRTAYGWSSHPSDPGILTLEKKTFYEPYASEYIHSYGLPSVGGKVFPGQRFSPTTEERFCAFFLGRSENIKEFKEMFGRLKHPDLTNELIDDLAASILVYNFTERILDAIQKGEEARWSDLETSLLRQLLESDITLRAYSGISNIIPDLGKGGQEHRELDIIVKTKKRSKETRIRLPHIDDFPKYIELDSVTGENEIPKDYKRASLTPSSIIVSAEENAIQIPIRFHKKKSGFFMELPNFYTSIVPFDLSLQWMYWELNKTLIALGLLQSVTCLNFTIWGCSIYLGDRLAYNYYYFIENYRQGACNKFYEWNLRDDRRLKSTKNLLGKLLEGSRVMRIYESEGNRTDGDKRLRNAFRTFNDLVESKKDDTYKLRMAIEALEKFFSNGKYGKEDTENGLKNLVNLAFDERSYILDVFKMGYCLRSKYTHYELEMGDLRECLKKVIRGSEEDADDEGDYYGLVSSLCKTHLELLRLTILTCLISPLTANDFSDAMRSGRLEKIPKNIKSLVPEGSYLDDTIKRRIKYESKRNGTV